MRMPRTVAGRLAEALGGKWRYDGITSWNCDDGKRRVSRTSAGVDEFDNPLGPPQYYLYGDGSPVLVSDIVARMDPAFCFILLRGKKDVTR